MDTSFQKMCDKYPVHNNSYYSTISAIIYKLLNYIIVMITILDITTKVNGVTVTQVNIISINSGRGDYVIQGESVQLSCHYMITKSDEKIQSVRWEKDGQDVYFSTPNKRRPIAIGVLKGHIDYNSKDLLNTVVILNVTLEMHGTYSCHVDSDINRSQNSATLTVIIDACKEGNWKTHTDMINCTEDISFYCIGMFPKPSPACSIHNDFTGKYFAGETFDLNNQLPNGTYEISIRRRYHVDEFIQYPGQLSFRCHLLIMMTSWRMGINYKLFGDSGCIEEPPKINNGTYVITGEQTCWRTPRENSRVNYTCDDGFLLMGPSILMCHNGSWIPDPIHLMSTPVSDMRRYSTLSLKMPYCSNSSQTFLQKFTSIYSMISILLSLMKIFFESNL